MNLCKMARVGRLLGALGLALLFVAACSRDAEPASVIAEARELMAAGKSGEAHVRLKNLLAKHGAVPTARVLLAQIALDNGDTRAADAELAALEPADLADPEALAVRTWVDYGMGNHQQALERLEASDTEIPLSERARLRATGLRMSGAGADALPLLREALAADPDDGRLVAELAATLTVIGNLGHAERELDAFLEAHPEDADALQARGELRLRRGALAKASEDLNAALAAAPPSWPRLKRISTELLLGDAALTQGDLEKAKAVIGGLQERYPGAFGPQLLVTRLALLEGRPSEAVDMLQRLADAMPNDQRVHSLLIEALLRSGNRARAATLLERRIQQNPADAAARKMLAELLMQQSRPDRVIALLSEAPEVSVSAEAEDDSLLSMARLAQQRAGAAIASLEAALAENPGDERARVQLAAAYLQNGQATRGLATLDGGSSRSPEAIGVRLALNFALANDREVNRIVTSLLGAAQPDVAALIAAADAAQRAGRNDILGNLVDKALQHAPKNEDALMRRANLDFVEGRYDAAAKALDTLIGLAPDDVGPRIAMARVAEARGDVPGARAALEAAIRADASSIEPALMLASLELRAKQPQAASAVLDRMMATAPRDGVAANAAGAVLLRANRPEEARARFGTAVEQNGTDARFRFNLGRAQFLAGDREAAAQSFREAAKLQPNWVEAHLAAVRLALELRQGEAALQAARAMVDHLPKDARSWLLMGDAQMLAGRAPDAVASFAKAYGLQASAPAAVREHLARRVSRTARPEQPLLNWLAREPDDLDVRRRLADFYQQTGATKLAVAQFERIVKGAPNDVASLNNLAWLLAESDTPRAEELVRRAMAIVPQQAAIADTLGWVLIQAGKYAEAAEALKGAVAAMPDDRAIRYRYALASARAGDKDTARRELQAVLKDDATFEGRDAAQQLSQELGS